MLSSHDAVSQDNMLRAARLFWSAMFDAHDWPEPLRNRAESIVEQILGNGPLETSIATMDDELRERVAQQIRQFAADFDDARRRG